MKSCSVEKSAFKQEVSIIIGKTSTGCCLSVRRIIICIIWSKGESGCEITSGDNLGDNFAKIPCRRTVEEEERKVILNLNRGRSLGGGKKKKKERWVWVCFVSFLNLKQPKHSALLWMLMGGTAQDAWIQFLYRAVLCLGKANC